MISPIFTAHSIWLSNGVRYWRRGGHGQGLGAETTRSQKNARKCRRIPHVRRRLCWTRPLVRNPSSRRTAYLVCVEYCLESSVGIELSNGCEHHSRLYYP